MKGRIIKISSLILYSENITGTKTDILRRFIILNVDCWHPFFIRKSLGLPCTIFQRFYPGTFLCLFQCKIPVDFFIFSRVLKPGKLNWTFQREFLEIFHTFKLTSFEPCGIHKYRVLNKIWIQDILGQSIVQQNKWNINKMPNTYCRNLRSLWRHLLKFLFRSQPIQI